MSGPKFDATTESVFELVTARSGAKSIRQVGLDQTMHGPTGPWVEANELYVAASGLTRRLRADTREDLVLFDVGLGAASNALAAIRATLDLGETRRRRLHIVSFECEMALLEFALTHFDAFPHFVGFRDALETILSKREWRSPCGSVFWELRVGDFLATIVDETNQPEIIFHDPYSPAANPGMWGVQCFSSLCKLAKNNDESTSLYTYSCATPIRAALLIAGFYVGQGPSTGFKKSTTQASTRLENLADPLGERWLQRWQRSHTRYPFDVDTDRHEATTRQLLAHPQFADMHIG